MADNEGDKPEVNMPDVKAGAKKAVNMYGSSLIGLWLGAALMILGSFMSWAKVGGLSVDGFDDRGEITLIAGLVIAAVGALPYLKQLNFSLSKQAGYWIVLASAYVSGYIVGDFAGDVRDANAAINDSIGEFSSLFSGLGKTSLSLGVWVVVVGALVALLAAGMMNLGKNAKSVQDVKSMSQANKKFVFLPAGIFLVLFLIMYL